MATTTTRKPKKHYFILHNGIQVGESWAVSPAKAISNWWWKHVKGEDEYSSVVYSQKDFDAVEV